MSMPRITLNTGRLLPSTGLGFWKVPNERAAQLVGEAITAGYRHFDCASDYGNEKEVGDGLEKAIRTKQVRREELWVTSKLWNTYHRPENVSLAVKKTLSDLKLDELDLYLIHFPISLAFVPFEKRYPAGWVFEPDSPNPSMKYSPIPVQETWQAMEELVEAGLVKDIGVSNFNISLLRNLLTTAKVRPSVLQVELHPLLTQEKLLKFCRDEQITVTGFSPFGAKSYLSLGMAKESEDLLTHQLIQSIAEKHRRTPAQILLRWGIQRGTAVVPKTTSAQRLVENLATADFELLPEEMSQISELNQNRRFNDPGEFCAAAFGTFFPIYE